MFYIRSMASRWKNDRPMSRTAFNERFPDEAARTHFLFEKRWSQGFVCPACGGLKAWELTTKRFTFECAACRRQTSVTAGAVFHRSHLNLLIWFQAIYAIASHSNGISELQLQAQFGLGSYKTAWLMLQKLRRAMIDPDRSLLEDLVEVDESDIPYRTKADPIAGGQGRSAVGKLHFIGAIELSPEGHPRRIRLAPLADFSAKSISVFVASAIRATRDIAQRRLLGLQEPQGLQPQAQGRRQNGGACRLAVDPSGLRQFQALGARRLSRRTRATPAPLPRRVRLSLESATPHEIVVRHATRHRR